MLFDVIFQYRPKNIYLLALFMHFCGETMKIPNLTPILGREKENLGQQLP